MGKSTIQLVEEWVIPLVKELARSQVDGESSTEGSPRDPVTPLAKFHFSACDTPNVREKVWWNPGQHTWQINAKKANALIPKETFKVDPKLDVSEYNAAKAKTYTIAVGSWNDLDGSTRHHIPLE